MQNFFLQGCARNFVDGVIYFLRKKVGDFDYGEKNRRYNGLLDKHRDIILNQFKYSVKKEIFQEFPSEPRDIAGRIKYESVITFIMLMHGQ